MKRVSSQDMTVGKPLPLIIQALIPLLIGYLCQQFYYIAEAVIVGRSLNENSLAALGVGSSIFTLVSGFVTGITSGFSIIVAQQLGAKKESDLRRSIAVAFELCGVCTVVCILLLLVTLKPLLGWIHTPDSIYEDVYEYAVIIYVGVIAFVIYNMVLYLLRALGDNTIPFWLLTGASVLMVVLDLAAICWLNMGVKGAAWSMILAQGSVGIAGYVYARRKYPVLRLRKEDYLPEKRLIHKEVNQGLNMAIQTCIANFGCLILQGAVNQLGAEQVASYTAAGRVLAFLMQPAITLGLVVANYTGQNHGAGRMDRIREGTKVCTKLALGYCVGAILVMNVFGEGICRMFLKGMTDQMAAACGLYMRIASVFFLFVTMLQIHRNVLYGMGHCLMNFLTGIFETVARCFVAFWLFPAAGYLGICFGNPLAWVAAEVPLVFTYIIIMKKQKNR